MKLIKKCINTNKDDLNILSISDLHICENKDVKLFKKIINYINNNQIDIVCVIGDIIDSTKTLDNIYLKDKLINFFIDLSKFSKIYIVLGNHDLGYFKDKKWLCDDKRFYDEVIKKIINYNNIYYLNNNTLNINDEYTISGIFMPYNYANHDYEGDENVFKDELNKINFINNLDNNKENILICHYPKTIFNLEKLGYLDNFKLIIAGHNHSGVTQNILLEFIINIFDKNKGIITPSKSMKIKDTKNMRGIIKLSNNKVFIINPSITTFGKTSSIFRIFNRFFYMGASLIKFIKK